MLLTLAPRTHGRPTTDAPSPIPAPADRGRSFLTRLLGDGPALPPFAPAPLPAGHRTPAEADAVARALGCPDLFVIDAADRATRERIIASVARAAAGRGERVVVLSPDPAAADRLTEAVAADSQMRVARALAADENPHRPLPGATRLTSAALGRGRVELLRRDAAAVLHGAEAELDSLATAAAAAEELRTLSHRLAEIERERAALAARLDGVEAEVRAEADGHASAALEWLDSLRSDLEAATAVASRSRIEAAAKCREKEAALAAARQHHADACAAAAKKSGFLSRLLHKPKPAPDAADLERQIHDLDREVKELADQEAAARAEIEAAGRRFADEREKRITEQVTARRDAVDSRVSSLLAERDAVAGRFAERVRGLQAVRVAAPAHPSAEAVERVAAEIAARQAEAETRLAAARTHLDELNRTGDDTARRFLAETRVVVGTPGSVAADPLFETTPDAGGPPFGLLVLDHAEELAEADFARLARLAGRWVLAGDVTPRDDHAAPGNGMLRRPGRHAEPGFAGRLLRRLDREPWAVEPGRLVCRIAHPGRRALTCEPLLDRPEIELRFCATDADDVVLAAVAFPADTPATAAREFVAAQLGEAVLRPCGERHWHEDGGRSTACWPAADIHDGEWVVLEPGVREKVVGAGAEAFTAAVAFDAAAGWDAASAEAWLQARLAAGSSSRVAVLPRPHGTSHT